MSKKNYTENELKGILKKNPKDMTYEELDIYHRSRTETIGGIIEYLKKNFKETDRICYMNCVKGLKNDCTPITKEQLGDRFFYYVKELKEELKNKQGLSQEACEEMYPYVEDDDVVMI